MAKRLINIVLLVIALVLLAAAAALGDGVRLRSWASTVGPEVKLAEVADLDGVIAEGLGELVVGRWEQKQKKLTVSLSEVHRLLDERGVNWGKLTLGGFERCEVEREVEDPSAPDAALVEPEASTPEPSMSRVLRERIESLIAELVGVERGELRIEFARADDVELAREVIEERYEIEIQSASGLGRVPVVVRMHEAGAIVRTVRLSARVSRRVNAVTATHTISRGHVFAAGDVEVREVWLTDGRGEVLDDVDMVVGRVCGSTLRRGAAVRADHVKEARLVRRGETISVRSVAGALVVKTSAEAMEDGVMEQVIRVRNARSRESFMVRVIGVREGLAGMSDSMTSEGGSER